MQVVKGETKQSLTYFFLYPLQSLLCNMIYIVSVCCCSECVEGDGGENKLIPCLGTWLLELLFDLMVGIECFVCCCSECVVRTEKGCARRGGAKVKSNGAPFPRHFRTKFSILF